MPIWLRNYHEIVANLCAPFSCSLLMQESINQTSVVNMLMLSLFITIIIVGIVIVWVRL